MLSEVTDPTAALLLALQRPVRLASELKPLSNAPRPFSRYMGGKQRSATAVVDALAEFRPDVWPVYCPPFAGMEAVLYEAIARGHITAKTHIRLGDASRATIEAWWAIRTHGAGVLKLMAPYAEAYQAAPRETFDAWRVAYNTGDRAVGLQFALRWTVSNGIWRVNGQGELNSSWCKTLTIRHPSAERLDACQRVLNWPHVAIWHAPWQATLTAAVALSRRLVIYADPPYLDGETKYTAGGFGFAQTKELMTWLGRAHAGGACVAVSNHDRRMFRDMLTAHLPTARVSVLRVGREVSFTSDARTPVNEILAVAG